MAELVNLEKKDRKAYEESLKNYRDLKNALEASEAMGIEKGIEKGIRETVVKFFKAGVSLELISQALGMGIEEIKGILKDVS